MFALFIMAKVDSHSDFLCFLRSFCLSQRDDAFFEPVVEALKASGFPCVSGEELMGAEAADLTCWPSEGVHKAFLRRVFRECYAPAQPAAPCVSVQSALSSLGTLAPSGPPPVTKKKLNVAARLAAVSLDSWPSSLLPPQDATDSATTGGRFEFVDVRSFLPSWARDGLPDKEKEVAPNLDCVALVSLAKALGLPTKAKEVPLNLTQWCGGYTRMALHQVADGPFPSPCVLSLSGLSFVRIPKIASIAIVIRSVVRSGTGPPLRQCHAGRSQVPKAKAPSRSRNRIRRALQENLGC